MPSPSAVPLAVPIREAARLLSLSTRTVYRMAKDGRIPCVRTGVGRTCRMLFSVSNLQEWVNRKERSAVSQVPPSPKHEEQIDIVSGIATETTGCGTNSCEASADG